MAAELQQLLEKIQKEGVDKANAEAAKIIAEANAKAKAIVNEANLKAQATEAAAAKKSEEDARRAAETIRQAARDTVISVGNSVEKLLTSILTKNVDAALADPATVSSLAAAAVKAVALGTEAEVATAAKLVDAVRAELAKAAVNGVTVVMDETVGSGFAVKLDAGRVEHSFTSEAIAAALAKRLRPALAELLK